jgi:hypothetical protein
MGGVLHLLPPDEEPFMASEFNTPFDVYRANLDIASRMFTSAQKWHQHASTREKLFIEGDVDALRRVREPVWEK